MVRAVRGAVRVPEDSSEAIHSAATRLLSELLSRNAMTPERIVSILFSMTCDLTRANPAAAARSLGLSAVPLFCLQEARVEGAMERVIRTLITFHGDKEPQPVYLDGAEELRPDLFGKG